MLLESYSITCKIVLFKVETATFSVNIGIELVLYSTRNQLDRMDKVLKSKLRIASLLLPPACMHRIVTGIHIPTCVAGSGPIMLQQTPALSAVLQAIEHLSV